MLLGKELDASYNTKKDNNINILTEEEVKDTYDADTEGDGMTVKMSTSSSSSVQSNEQCSYTLETMTPDLVQTGECIFNYYSQFKLLQSIALFIFLTVIIMISTQI